MNRRKFLQEAGAAMAAGLIVPVALGRDSRPAAATQEANSSRITAVIFDELYRDSVAFADTLAAHGAKAFAANGNSAALWYGPLRAHLASAPGRVAGLTSEADCGVSLACGRERRLKPLYQGAHDARPLPSIAHRIQCAHGQDEIAAALRNPAAPWPASLAGALLRLSPPRMNPWSAAMVTAQMPPLATTPLSPGFPGYLVSWLLAWPDSSRFFAA